ncbi:hypothetical protein HHB66_00925 [Neisseria meningitidis]|uniref:hypothetical protein n=1 Tax=Neisseria meningitidis TaxID=487 RepID=UPI001C56B96F|nr:hypothetical protein [Neisseria meningitidis]MBW4004493.1 hypothetical protein [Neisseria meningitidis]
MSSETVFNFQTAFPSFETGYWELSSSKILHLLLPRQHLGQNGRRLKSKHRPSCCRLRMSTGQPQCRRNRRSRLQHCRRQSRKVGKNGKTGEIKADGRKVNVRIDSTEADLLYPAGQ